MKKGLLFLFIASLLLMAGCGGKNPGGSNGKVGDFTVSMLYRDSANYAYDENWMIWSEIKENTGASFDIKAVPSSDYVAKRQLAFNTGELPDIISMTFATGEQVASGLVLPISKYEDQMPNYSAFIEKYGLREALDRTKIEGEYYTFPVKCSPQPIQAHNWMIRTDIFEKNNIPVPTTLDEVLEAGKLLKEIYPDSVPITNRFAQGNLMTGIGAGFGGVAGWNFSGGMKYQFEPGKDWTFFPTTDNWREMCEYTNALLENGVLDIEWNTLDSVVYEQLVTQGKTFIMFDWSMNVTRYHNEGRKLDPDFQVNTIVAPTGPYGDYATHWSYFWEQGWTISASVADKPYFEDFLAMLDWFYTDEAEILMTSVKKENTLKLSTEYIREQILEIPTGLPRLELETIHWM